MTFWPPNAASLARALVRFVLAQWGLRDVVDDAELVASELATNAVQATAEEEKPEGSCSSFPPRASRQSRSKTAVAGEPWQPCSATAASAPTSPPPAATAATLACSPADVPAEVSLLMARALEKMAIEESIVVAGQPAAAHAGNGAGRSLGDLGVDGA
jgi:hypothetical protein